LNFLNLLYTKNIFYTRQTVLLNIIVLFLFWVSRREVNTDRRREILNWVIVGSGILVSIEALCQQYLGGGILIPWTKQPIGTIGNTNYLGCFLLFPIFATVALFSTPRAGMLVRRFVIPTSFLLLVGALVLSRARASWLGFGVGFGLWLFLTLRRRVFACLAFSATALVILSVIYFPHSMKDWTETSTLIHRFHFFRASLELWEQSPLFGTGFGSFRNQVYETQARLGQKDPEFWKDYIEPKPRHVHNDYLEALNDGGLLYFIAFWGFIFWNMRNIRRRGLSKAHAATWCGLIAVMVSALFFFPTRMTETYTLFFVQMGALCNESS
jgi:O-antigen ligase